MDDAEKKAAPAADEDLELDELEDSGDGEVDEELTEETEASEEAPDETAEDEEAPAGAAESGEGEIPPEEGTAEEADPEKNVSSPTPAPKAAGKTPGKGAKAVKEELPEKLPPEDAALEAPVADSARIQPAEATEIQIPEAFLHAEYRKGTSASVARMPILVTFEVGRQSLRLGDLETLQEGFVFACENPMPAAVNLCANGQLIGRGSLLNIEGRIGVRVTEIF